MTEEEIFKKLLSRNPNPGTKNSLIRENNLYKIPGWVFGSKENYLEIKYKLLNRTLIKHGFTSQIFWDIYVLGLTNIDQRPKCPICNSSLKFQGLAFGGYYKTCGSRDCKCEFARIEVSSLWQKTEYRNTQSNSHIEWASKDENKAKMREHTLNLWKNPDYRERLINSHIEWASKDENKAKMREATIKVWQRPGYREKQSEIHKEYAKNNPDKMKNGICGFIESSKSVQNSIRYESSWEKNFIEVLEDIDKVVTVKRAEFYIPYSINNKKFNYFPDFCIITDTNKKYIVEIKANWMIELNLKTPYKLEAGKEYVRIHSEYSGYLVLKDEDLCDPPHFKKFNKELAIRSIINLIN